LNNLIGAASALDKAMPLIPIFVASLAVGIFVATLRLDG